MWEQIKQILKKNKGTCIIVEEEQPAYVIIPFNDYQKGLENESVGKAIAPRFKESVNELESREKINQEIIDWRVKQAEDVAEVQLADIQESDEIRVEDLPLV